MPQSEMNKSGSASNMVDGQFIQIEGEFVLCVNTLSAVINKIPSQVCTFLH